MRAERHIADVGLFDFQLGEAESTRETLAGLYALGSTIATSAPRRASDGVGALAACKVEDAQLREITDDLHHAAHLDAVHTARGKPSLCALRFE